jgi:hypothetical protein
LKIEAFHSYPDHKQAILTICQCLVKTLVETSDAISQNLSRTSAVPIILPKLDHVFRKREDSQIFN